MAITLTRLDNTGDGATAVVPLADGSVAEIQDIYNAIRTFEAQIENLDMRILTLSNTPGKIALGGGLSVGITLRLINRTCIQFEARPGPAVIGCNVRGGNLAASHTWDGTVTTPDAGTTLIDSAATFARNGTQTGDVIRNVTDGSTATVTTVDSETQITHTALSGGTGDDWGAADVWEIDTSHPICPTANTHVDYAQDTSASLVNDLSQADLDASFASTEAAVETLRKIMGNRAVVAADDGTITIYEDDSATPAVSATVSADRRERSKFS